MKFSKVQIAIAAGAGFLVLLGFFIYLMWLNGQPPVLAKSLEVDPLTKVPLSIDLNPLRDRTSERSANEFLRAMRDGHCNEQLADWEKDYRKRYAAFICDSEAKHPLASWRIVDWGPAVLGKVLRQAMNGVLHPSYQIVCTTFACRTRSSAVTSGMPSTMAVDAISRSAGSLR